MRPARSPLPCCPAGPWRDASVRQHADSSSYGEPVPTAVMKVHRLHGQENGEFHLQAALRSGRAELELAAAADHVFEDLFESELILAGPVGDELADLGAVAAEEARRELF